MSSDTLTDALAENVLVLIEQQYLRGMLDFMRDEAGWDLLGEGAAAAVLKDTERLRILRRARLYARLDALCCQTLRLYRDFCFAQPFILTGKDEGAEAALKHCYYSRVNRVVFGHQALRDGSDSLLTDGERFYAIFGRGPAAKFRVIDPLQIERIVTNPDDATEPWWYLRTWTNQENKLRRRAYRALYAPMKIEPPPADFTEAEGEVAIYHVALSPLGGRGVSLFAAALPWAKGYRRFMESRVALQQALARFAWRRKLRGGAAHIAAAQTAEQSTLATGDTETNPPPAFGSTWLENEGDTREQLRTDTGAAAARTDGGMLLAVFGSAVGIFPTYFGVDTLARMATAASMELPMLRMFQAYQTLHQQILLDLLEVGFDLGDEDDIEDLVDIQTPAIGDVDALATVQAGAAFGAAQATAGEPSILGKAPFVRHALGLLGIRNPDAVLEADGGGGGAGAAEEEGLTESLGAAADRLNELRRNLSRVDFGGNGGERRR